MIAKRWFIRYDGPLAMRIGYIYFNLSVVVPIPVNIKYLILKILNHAYCILKIQERERLQDI